MSGFRLLGGSGRGIHSTPLFPRLIVRREELVELRGGEKKLVLEGREEDALHVVCISTAKIARCSYP
jgi:hypothetical protein